MISQRSCGCRTLGFYLFFLPKSYIWSKRNHFLCVNAAQDPINVQQCFCCGPSQTKNAHSTWGSVQIGLCLLQGDRESRPNYHPLDSTTEKKKKCTKTKLGGSCQFQKKHLFLFSKRKAKPTELQLMVLNLVRLTPPSEGCLKSVRI